VLRRVAELAARIFATSTSSALRGEEFAMVLPQADLGTAFSVVAERLREPSRNRRSSSTTRP